MGVRLADRGNLICDTLRSIRMFAGYSEAELARLRDAAQLWRFEKREILVSYGSELGGLWILVEGSLLSHRDNSEGRRIIQGIVMPGDPYGIVPLFDAKPALTTLSARSDALAVFLPRAPLLGALHNNADRLLDVVNYLTNRTRLDYERVQMGFINSLRCQLAKYIFYFSGESFWPFFDGAVVDWSPPIAATQEEIADMMGVSRQSVNELMTAMAREGVLKRSGSQFCVADYLKLLAIIEEDEGAPPEWRAILIARHEALAAKRSVSKPHRSDGRGIPGSGLAV